MTSRPQELRRSQTDAERLLWFELRDRRLAGWKFRRPHPIGPFVADFVSLERKLVVEIDGGQHAERVQDDRKRTALLEQLGFRVVRYWNNEVLGNVSGVLEDMLKHLGGPSPQPSPRTQGEGASLPSPCGRGVGGEGKGSP
jgi:adenine-specific DNA-methyltransferase